MSEWHQVHQVLVEIENALLTFKGVSDYLTHWTRKQKYFYFRSIF